MKKKLVIAALAIVILSVGGVVLATKNNADVPAPTPIVTKTPTEAVEPTKEPAETPQVTEAVTVAPTEVITPTVAPVVTVEPTATLVPTPVPSMLPTPTPTSMPVPTKAPEETLTPTPVPVAEEDLLLKVQMGDSVWYEYYEGGILVVTGKGATWDFSKDDEHDVRKDQYVDSTEEIVDAMIDEVKIIYVEEGITRIDAYALGIYPYAEQVHIPSTLKEVGAYGLRSIGKRADTTTKWFGLDLSKLDAHEHAFLWAKGLDGMETGNLILNPTATPTPTPTNTPTPTPIPDLNNPRLCHTYKMGANVTFEFWDNGYLYVKGTGSTVEKGELFSWIYWREPGFVQLAPEFVKGMVYVVIEEGITHVGTGAVTAKELWLPKSVTSVADDSFVVSANGIVHGYRNGKKYKAVTERKIGLYEMFQSIVDAEFAEEYGITITEE